ncbi:MAG: tetratricopeptide repeat protein [Chitinispirillia bacterium]|nr:tetratricopeptide repeat protein [Chitinispirillia bacterium]
MITFFSRKITRVRNALIVVGMMAVATQVAAEGLPGEYVITDRWRHIYSMYSGITNPAYINEENYMSLRFLFANTLQEFYMQEAGFTMPIDLYGAFGVAWMMQGAGKYDGSNNIGEPTGLTIVDQSHFIALSYAHNVWSGLTVGGNLNVIVQNVPNVDPTAGNEMRFGFGIDVGLSYKLVRHQLLGNHILGLSTNNIFNMIMNTDEKYSAALRFSLLSDFWERRIYYGADFVMKDIMVGDEEWRAGVTTKDMPWELSQKIGFNVLRIFKLYMLAGFNPEGFDHYGFAFGANMPGFFNGRDIEGMMQFVSVGNSDASHITFYARTELGKHREEIYARKMARRGTLGPNNLYNQALELYYRGEFYRAYWIFSQIAVEYPDFFRNDMVSYYQAACHEGMDLRQSAVTAFRRTKEEHSRSTAVPLADLGLMRVFYRSGDFSAVEAQFEELNALGVPDSIKFHAYYIMGQTSMQRGDYTRARQLFTMIPENHPDYVFAYHSAAVSNMMNDNLQGAIADLEFVVQFKPKNKAQEEAIHRSFVFLGFLYYEDLNTEGALARAVTALRRVPRTSYYYQDALLGLGWTALKARQWGDCLSAGAELTRSSTHPILQSEGLLIQAYAHAMQRNYSQAINLLDDAARRLNEYRQPNESELAQNKSEYQGVRGDYESMGVAIDELGQARQSSVVQSSIDSLQAPQGRMKTAIDGHHRFEDEFKRGMFFGRNLDQVKEDVDYALARFARYRGAGGQRGSDDELERLRRELESME